MSTIINGTINADIIDPTLTLELGEQVVIAAAVRKIIVRHLRFLHATRLVLQTPGLLIKSDIIQGRAAVTWPGAGTAAGKRLPRATNGPHGTDGANLPTNAFGVAGNPGAAGTKGDNGVSGTYGADAPSLRIAYSSDASYGVIWVDLRGQDGQPGQDGGHGGYGGNGSQGGPPQLDPYCTGCLVPQGRGGHAGAGGNGGDAGHGGNGGCGGYIKFHFGRDPDPSSTSKYVPAHRIMMVANTIGGSGESPGRPGQQGRGGVPGLGGPSLGPCHASEVTLSGHPAHDGLPGNLGEPGASGDSPEPDIRVISVLEYNAIN